MCLQVTDLSLWKKALKKSTNLQSEVCNFWFIVFLIVFNNKDQVKIKGQYYFKDNN